MSGLSRTPGKRVRVNSPPRVRIPPVPPIGKKATLGSLFYWAQCSVLFGGNDGHGFAQHAATLHTALYLALPSHSGEAV